MLLAGRWESESLYADLVFDRNNVYPKVFQTDSSLETDIALF